MPLGYAADFASPSLPPSMTPRIAFVASKTPEALASLAELHQRFGEILPQDADIIVALGGDGFMLQTLHRHMALG